MSRGYFASARFCFPGRGHRPCAPIIRAFPGPLRSHMTVNLGICLQPCHLSLRPMDAAAYRRHDKSVVRRREAVDCKGSRKPSRRPGQGCMCLLATSELG
jgi:hypothetical protein